MLTAKNYTQHRAQFDASFKNSVLVLSAFNAMQQTNDSAAPFVQESHFLWATGITEPEWMLVWTSGKSWLIAPDISETHRVFDGGLSDDEAKTISGVDMVVSASDGKKLLTTLAETYSTVHCISKDPHARHYGFIMNPSAGKLEARLKRIFRTVLDARKSIDQLKAIKSSSELALMQEAINLTVNTFAEVKNNLSMYGYEYEVEASFTYAFRKSGATGHAYEPIVATGGNACTLHYHKNQAAIKDGDLLVMDIGARVGGYAADITRTYAVGTPTARQVAVHAAVESAHHEIIGLLKPGLSVKEYGEQVDDIMRTALRSLDLLKTESDYRKYFPHSVSHGLGLDVHDSLGAPDVFVEGMVLTVEPGIYIPEEKIGVRIEDDILITKGGNRNLSAALPTSL